MDKSDETDPAGFTSAVIINRDYGIIKGKIGEKKAKKYFEQADRLINPNRNMIVEYRVNGIVTKVGDKYLFYPLADMELYRWRVLKPVDITDQFASLNA